jgi:2'-5' RNA ligase
MHRLFVAIELPPEVKERLRMLCFGLPGAKWVDEDQMHLTLRFVGEVDGGVMEDVLGVLATVNSEPFDILLKGIGFFPPRQTPQQLWVGVEESEQLTRLHGRIDAALRRIGIEKELRKFYPHVTLARLKGTKASRIGDYLVEFSLFQTGPFTAREFSLFSSVLGSKGPVHRIEADYPLETKGVGEE